MQKRPMEKGGQTNEKNNGKTLHSWRAKSKKI